MEPTKRCKKCQKDFPVSHYYTCAPNKSGKRYLYSYCRACSAENRKAWHFTPKGQAAYRKIALKAYGLTQEQYDAMLAAQGHVCAICGKAETRLNRARTRRVRVLSVDHDHSSDRVRGLLCSACNSGLSSFRDNPATLLAAVAYLQSRQAGFVVPLDATK